MYLQYPEYYAAISLSEKPAIKGFALNHNISLQMYFFCAKQKAKNNILKDVESREGCSIARALDQ